MTLRGARILLAGACTEAGSSLVEAFLALGAHVVAADGLRTRLEELRARMRHHERLWVAECDLGGAESALALFADVARDEPIDTALLVLSAGADGPEQALLRCRSFLDAALATMAQQDHGRVLVLLEAGTAEVAAGDLVNRQDAEDAKLQKDAKLQNQLWLFGVCGVLAVQLKDCGVQSDVLCVGGLVADGEWLPKVVALADPARPPLRGFEP